MAEYFKNPWDNPQQYNNFGTGSDYANAWSAENWQKTFQELDEPDPQSGGGSLSNKKKKLPPFSELIKYYPTTSDYKSVIRSINPKYEKEPAYQNTCAMRLSIALNNCAGHEIPKIKSLECIIGIDKKRYAIKVKEMKKYLKDTYIGPDFVLKAEKGVIDNSFILNKTGVIVFDVTGWKDASGHFSLWDGQNVVYAGGHNYFDFYEIINGSNKVIQVVNCFLWEC